MQGLRTLLFNLLGLLVVTVATWATGVDWTQYVSPNAAMAIVFAANMVLRCVTTTPVLQKSQVTMGGKK